MDKIDLLYLHISIYPYFLHIVLWIEIDLLYRPYRPYCPMDRIDLLYPPILSILSYG